MIQPAHTGLGDSCFPSINASRVRSIHSTRSDGDGNGRSWKQTSPTEEHLQVSDAPEEARG
jgi:hypothetical protein